MELTSEELSPTTESTQETEKLLRGTSPLMPVDNNPSEDEPYDTDSLRKETAQSEITKNMKAKVTIKEPELQNIRATTRASGRSRKRGGQKKSKSRSRSRSSRKRSTSRRRK